MVMRWEGHRVESRWEGMERFVWKGWHGQYCLQAGSDAETSCMLSLLLLSYLCSSLNSYLHLCLSLTLLASFMFWQYLYSYLYPWLFLRPTCHCSVEATFIRREHDDNIKHYIPNAELQLFSQSFTKTHILYQSYDNHHHKKSVEMKGILLKRSHAIII